MWVNIDVVSNDKSVIFLPEKLASEYSSEVQLCFGKRSSEAIVIASKDIKIQKENTFEKPLKIAITNKIKRRLQIPTGLTYKIKFNADKIEIGPVIGLLLGNRNHIYNKRYMVKYSDRCGIYKEVGGLLCAFSPRSIDWNNFLAYGLYYDPKDNEWKYGRFPIPSTIYRRDFHTDNETIKRLSFITEGKLFNSWRFNKFYFYKHLGKDKYLLKHLPLTELSLNYEQIKDFIDINIKTILKPINLSRGRGLIIINKEGGKYIVEDYRQRLPEKIILTEDNLKEFFDKNQMLFNNYLIQKQILLAKIDGSPFDIRIVMQRNQKSQWKDMGIECRVANKNTLVTNISRGGYALNIEEALKSAFPNITNDKDIKDYIDDLCYRICQRLDETGQHFAEFGLDLGIDEDKKIWIIEANVFPSFKGFKTMDHETYLKIRYAPIQYSASIAGFL